MKLGRLGQRWLKASQWGAICGGIVFTIAAAGMATYEWSFLRTVARVDGVVTHLDEGSQVEQDGSHTVTYAPVFTYSALGHNYTVHSKSGSNPPEFSVGQAVPVVYHKDRPTEAQIDTFGQKWGLAAIFGIFGPFIATLGGTVLLVPRRFGMKAPLLD